MPAARPQAAPSRSPAAGVRAASSPPAGAWAGDPRAVRVFDPCRAPRVVATTARIPLRPDRASVGVAAPRRSLTESLSTARLVASDQDSDPDSDPGSQPQRKPAFPGLYVTRILRWQSRQAEKRDGSLLHFGRFRRRRPQKYRNGCCESQSRRHSIASRLRSAVEVTGIAGVAGAAVAAAVTWDKVACSARTPAPGSQAVAILY